MANSKTNTEGGSFAETPTEEKDQPQVSKSPEEETVFTYLKQIASVIEAKEAQLAHHLDRIATALEKLAKVEKTTTGIMHTDITKASPEPPTPAPIPKPAPTPVSSLDVVKALFPKDLMDMLNFIEEKAGTVIIKPRQYLGSENFAKIASIVRSANGEYVSAGKESHFRVVKK